MRRKKEERQTVLGMLDEAGVTYDICRGGKHEQVEFFGRDGRRYKTTLCTTASDHRSLLNRISQLRRLLREVGFRNRNT